MEGGLWPIIKNERKVVNQTPNRDPPFSALPKEYVFSKFFMTSKTRLAIAHILVENGKWREHSRQVGQKGSVFPIEGPWWGIRRIAEKCHTSKDTVQRELRAMTDAFYVKTAPLGRGRAVKRTLLLPDERRGLIAEAYEQAVRRYQAIEPYKKVIGRWALQWVGLEPSHWLDEASHPRDEVSHLRVPNTTMTTQPSLTQPEKTLPMEGREDCALSGKDFASPSLTQPTSSGGNGGLSRGRGSGHVDSYAPPPEESGGFAVASHGSADDRLLATKRHMVLPLLRQMLFTYERREGARSKRQTDTDAEDTYEASLEVLRDLIGLERLKALAEQYLDSSMDPITFVESLRKNQKVVPSKFPERQDFLRRHGVKDIPDAVSTWDQTRGHGLSVRDLAEIQGVCGRKHAAVLGWVWELCKKRMFDPDTAMQVIDRYRIDYFSDRKYKDAEHRDKLWKTKALLGALSSELGVSRDELKQLALATVKPSMKSGKTV